SAQACLHFGSVQLAAPRECPGAESPGAAGMRSLHACEKRVERNVSGALIRNARRAAWRY
ncbi:MAG: hypothetical protein ACHQKY_16560, partial [Terriglobia bacterium]